MYSSRVYVKLGHQLQKLFRTRSMEVLTLSIKVTHKVMGISFVAARSFESQNQFHFHVFHSKDSHVSSTYQTCPWSKEVPFQLPEGGFSRPGSAVSGSEGDGTIKRTYCSIHTAIIVLPTVLILPNDSKLNGCFESGSHC